MLSYQNLNKLINTMSLEHPIFEAYGVELIEIDKTKEKYVLSVETLKLLVEKSDPNINIGMVKMLKEVRTPNQKDEIIQLDGKYYRVACNLALLTPEMQKDFDKTYKQTINQLKKAVKDYEKILKKQQKEKIKAARSIQL